MRSAMLPLFTPRDMTRIFLIGRNHVTKVARVMTRQGQDGQLSDLLVYLRALTACYLFLFLSMLILTWTRTRVRIKVQIRTG